jgi:hypothetical protein
LDREILQFPGEIGQPIVIAVRCTMFDPQILPFDITGLAGSAEDRGHPFLVDCPDWTTVEYSENFLLRLLGSERRMPRYGGCDNECDKPNGAHAVTSPLKQAATSAAAR